MKSIKIFALALLICNLNFAQDLIVTKSNDSIHCKITKVKSKYIYFVHKKNSKFKSTLIEKSQVKHYSYNYFNDKEIPKDSMPGYEKFPRHLIGLSGGYSHDPRRVNPDFLIGFDNYLKNLRSGHNIEANYSYFITKILGFGATVNYFRSDANQENVSGTDGFGNPIVSNLSNTIKVFFIGPSSTLRFLNKSNKNAFILNTSIGYLNYHDTFFYAEETVTTGAGLGTISSIGYNFGINNNLSLGIQLSIIASYYKNIEVKNADNIVEIELSRNETPIGSNRLDFSIGLRYQL